MNQLKYLFVYFALLLSPNFIFAQDSTFNFEVRLGINNSDMNYGIDELSDLLPIDDYPIYSSSGVGAVGYSIGVGLGWSLSKHFELITNIDYSLLNYDVSSGVFRTLTSTLGRPVQPETPTFIDGTVGYSFINIEPEIRYHFNPNKKEGLFVGASISNMIHLNTDWQFDVLYEDLRIENDVDFSEYQEGIEFKDLFFLGLNTGYYFKIKENFSIGPKFNFHFGLNPIVEDGSNVLSPTIFGFNVYSKVSF